MLECCPWKRESVCERERESKPSKHWWCCLTPFLLSSRGGVWRSHLGPCLTGMILE